MKVYTIKLSSITIIIITINNIIWNRNVKISSSFISNIESTLNLLYDKYDIVVKYGNFLFNSEKDTILFIKSNMWTRNKKNCTLFSIF